MVGYPMGGYPMGGYPMEAVLWEVIPWEGIPWEVGDLLISKQKHRAAICTGIACQILALEKGQR